MTRTQSKTFFTVHKNNGDEFIKVDKRQFDKFIDLIYDKFELKECKDCKHYLCDDGYFPLEPCSSCSRFYPDNLVANPKS